jgi:hypothetical protein
MPNAFRNFRIWRGHLPHWRADDVRYYVTFKHRRELDEAERSILQRQIVRPQGKRWDVMISCILPDRTELIFTVKNDFTGRPFELSDIVEGAKRKAGAQIIQKSGEKFPPFYNESFDRIIRDEIELEERWNEICEAPVRADLASTPEEYFYLWVVPQLEAAE